MLRVSRDLSLSNDKHSGVCCFELDVPIASGLAGVLPWHNACLRAAATLPATRYFLTVNTYSYVYQKQEL
jgi:hypothetical protein